MSLDLIWDGHGEQFLLLFTVGPLSWCVFEFYLRWIWEGLAKQILTLFTVGPLFGCAFGLYLALALEVDKNVQEVRFKHFLALAPEVAFG